MIVDGIIEAVWGIARVIFDNLPSFGFSDILKSDALETMLEIISSVCYFFPMQALWNVFSVIVGLMFLRAAISFLRTLWGILPVV